MISLALASPVRVYVLPKMALLPRANSPASGGDAIIGAAGVDAGQRIEAVFGLCRDAVSCPPK